MMKIKKIAAAAAGVAGGHRNNRHYRVRRPNSRACPNLRPNVACYLGTGINPAPYFGAANPDGLRAGRHQPLHDGQRGLPAHNRGLRDV